MNKPIKPLAKCTVFLVHLISFMQKETPKCKWVGRSWATVRRMWPIALAHFILPTKLTVLIIDGSESSNPNKFWRNHLQYKLHPNQFLNWLMGQTWMELGPSSIYFSCNEDSTTFTFFNLMLSEERFASASFNSSSLCKHKADCFIFSTYSIKKGK